MDTSLALFTSSSTTTSLAIFDLFLPVPSYSSQENSRGPGKSWVHGMPSQVLYAWISGHFRQLAVLARTSLRPYSFASSPFDDFAIIECA